MALELRTSGSLSTRWFHGLLRGNSGQPPIVEASAAAGASASTATAAASARLSTGPDALGLALRKAPVATDVAVLAARDHVDGRAVADVLDLADRRGVDARQATGSEPVRVAADRQLDLAAVHEVELLL